MNTQIQIQSWYLDIKPDYLILKNQNFRGKGINAPHYPHNSNNPYNINQTENFCLSQRFPDTLVPKSDLWGGALESLRNFGGGNQDLYPLQALDVSEHSRFF